MMDVNQVHLIQLQTGDSFSSVSVGRGGRTKEIEIGKKKSQFVLVDKKWTMR